MVPTGAGPRFQRSDAIDIGDLFGADAGPGAGQGPSGSASEKLAATLFEDPLGALAQIDSIADRTAYIEHMALLERALAALLTRGGAARQLAIVVARLDADARGAPPGEQSPPAIASKVLHSIARPELLVHLADEALDGPPAEREPARRVLLQLGGAGAFALCGARERARAHGASWSGRPRFVAAMRELGRTPAGAGAPSAPSRPSSTRPTPATPPSSRTSSAPSPTPRTIAWARRSRPASSATRPPSVRRAAVSASPPSGAPAPTPASPPSSRTPTTASASPPSPPSASTAASTAIWSVASAASSPTPSPPAPKARSPPPPPSATPPAPPAPTPPSSSPRPSPPPAPASSPAW